MPRSPNRRKEVKTINVILMEGSKTEPKYIKELITFLGGDTKKIVIHDYVGSSPKNIQEKAKELKDDSQYGTIFCIFDKDSHDQKGGHYSNLKTLCRDNEKIFDASSVKSFEYWLYLHFKYSSAPIQDSDEILKKLRTEIADFKKGKLDFMIFANKLETAVANAKKSVIRFEEDSSDNPMTYMGHFVDNLKEVIKKQKET